MWNRPSIRLRRLARRVLSTGREPERAARGAAAGAFAAAVPIPGVQLPLSLLLAWLVRGHKGVAAIFQFISNPFTTLPLVWAEYWIGSLLWPGKTASMRQAVDGIEGALAQWVWSSPISSLDAVFSQLLGLGADIIGPLVLGIALSAVGLAALAYSLGLVAFTLYHAQRIEVRRRAGIGPRPAHPVVLPERADSTLPLAAAAERYAIHRVPLVQAEGVKLLVDGAQAYPEMLACIACACASIDLETYILCADHTGRRFGAALSAAAKRGVAVRLLYDGVGGMGLPRSYIDALLGAGVQVRVFRPFSTLWKSGFSSFNRRDHRKLLIVDQSIGFTGGLNIADNYAARENFGAGWRDTHLRIDGEVPVRQLAKLFTQTWINADEFAFAGGAHAPLPDSGVLPEPGGCSTEYTSRDVAVQILSNQEFLKRVRMRRAYQQAIRNAGRYIVIENAYFIPDRGIRRSLYRAAKRGVTVAVIIAKQSDVRLAEMASRALYSELLANGVRIFEYPASMVHSKCAVIDDIWSLIGSYNLDHRSLLHNLEAGVLLLDRTFARALREQLLRDIMKSREVRLEDHHGRSWSAALLESLAYQMRYWL